MSTKTTKSISAENTFTDVVNLEGYLFTRVKRLETILIGASGTIMVLLFSILAKMG
jgi:hypothetical protein